MNICSASHTTRDSRLASIGITLARTSRLRQAAAAALLLVSLTALAGCSTTEGLGDDIQHLGGNIEDSAARNK